MVGYNPYSASELSQRNLIIAGATSGFVTRAIVQPLDVVKIRFQLQIEPISSKCYTSKYSGFFQCFKIILREEGALAFWKGHVPAQLLSVAYNIPQFWFFEFLTSTAAKTFHDEFYNRHRAAIHFVSGSISGLCALMTSHPFDVLRTRFVAQGEPGIYKSLPHAVHTIIRDEGARAFYRGVVPAMVYAAPQAGLTFFFYHVYTRLWDLISHRVPTEYIGTSESLTCGSVASVSAKFVIYPLDLTKKRLQVQGFEAARKSFGQVAHYRGMTDCIVSIVKREGTRSLYKGLFPSVVKSFVQGGVSFWSYEQTCNFFRWMNHMST